MNAIILYRQEPLNLLDAITNGGTLHRIQLSSTDEASQPSQIKALLQKHREPIIIICDLDISDSSLLDLLPVSNDQGGNPLVLLFNPILKKDDEILASPENLKLANAVLLPSGQASSDSKIIYCTSSTKAIEKEVCTFFGKGSCIDIGGGIGGIDMFNKLRQSLEDIEKLALFLAENLASKLGIDEDLLADVLSHAAAKSGPACDDNGLPSADKNRKLDLDIPPGPVQGVVTECKERGIDSPFLGFVLKQTEYMKTSGSRTSDRKYDQKNHTGFHSWDFGDKDSKQPAVRGSQSVVVFGLGLMGMGIAKTLSAAFTVTGYDPDDERVKAAKESSIPCPSDLSPTLEDADYILFVAIADDQILEDIERHREVLKGRKTPVTIVSNSTISSTAAATIRSRVEEINPDIRFIVSPMSGGPPKTENGGLIILAGGERAHIEDALPLFRQISGRMYHVGKYVDAIHMKSIHQVVGLSNFMAGIEIMHIGRECGFNSRGLFDSLMATQSWNGYLMERWPAIERGAYEPQARLSIWLKDLGIVKHELREADQECAWVTDLESIMKHSAQHLGSDVADSVLAKEWPSWTM